MSDEYKAGDRVRIISDDEPLKLSRTNRRTGIRIQLRVGDVLVLVNDWESGAPYHIGVGGDVRVCFEHESGGITNSEGQSYFRILTRLIEPFIEAAKHCTCPLDLLMAQGCQCGGS
jgi:hypothetical protein